MHGHVSEERKLELLQSSWVNLTASSAEGWCLTVMEAAACATPSVAMAVGGLPESIVDGETGLLADDAEELAEQYARARARRRAARAPRRGARSSARSEFTWERHGPAQRSPCSSGSASAQAEQPVAACARLAQLATPAAPPGLAVAVMATNLIALVFTIVFARAARHQRLRLAGARCCLPSSS